MSLPIQHTYSAYRQDSCYWIIIFGCLRPLHRESRRVHIRQVFWLCSTLKRLPAFWQWPVACGYNGTYSCGTVGDFHSIPFLIASIANLTGAKIRINEWKTKFFLSFSEWKYLRRSQRYNKMRIDKEKCDFFYQKFAYFNETIYLCPRKFIIN